MPRGLSYSTAIQNGLEPQDYDWQAIPDGVWLGRLDFKIWGKSSNLVCYFTELATGRRYRVTAFRKRSETLDAYTPRRCSLDFAVDGNEGLLFRLTTSNPAEGKPAWLAAEPAAVEA